MEIEGQFCVKLIKNFEPHPDTIKQCSMYSDFEVSSYASILPAWFEILIECVIKVS